MLGKILINICLSAFGVFASAEANVLDVPFETVMTCFNDGAKPYMKIEKTKNITRLHVMNKSAVSYLRMNGVVEPWIGDVYNLELPYLTATRDGFEVYGGPGNQTKMYELIHTGLNSGKIQLFWKDNGSVRSYDFYNCRYQ